MSRRADVRPPGPKGRWLVGNSYDYDQDRIGFLKRCQAEYGDVFSFSSSAVFLSDPKLINELFRESNDAFLVEEPVFASQRDQRRLVERIDGWMRARSLVRRGMTTPVVRSHGRRVVARFDRTLRSLNGQEFDVVSVMRRYATCLVADFCFGSGSDEIAEASELQSELIATFMTSNLSIPKWLPLPSVRRALRAEVRAKELVAARIRQRRAQPRAQAEDLLDGVLAGYDEGLSDHDLVRLLSATMLASAGSPGTAMAWLVVELARHPDIQHTLREEAAAAIAKTGGVDDDRQLPNSQAFVKEVLRLYPPTWLMGRTVRRDFVLGDWPLVAGTRVMFSPYLVHRDPRWWPEPDEFRPERWQDPSETMVPHTFIPFGAGPRVCFGMHLGLYQMVTGAAHLAANYTVELSAAEQDSTTKLGALLEPRGARARITPLHTTVQGATSGSDPASRW